jgi:hypothetical protein
VSPITDLYDCPLDINLGCVVGLSYSRGWYARLLSIDLPEIDKRKMGKFNLIYGSNIFHLINLIYKFT